MQVCINLENSANLEVSSAYNSNSATLATTRKYLADADTRALIWQLIEPVLKSINVGRGISNEGISSFIDYIIDEYHFLKFEELKTFLSMLKLGKLGAFYDRVDLPTLCEMLRQYDLLRTDIAKATNESNKRGLIIDLPVEMPSLLIELAAKLKVENSLHSVKAKVIKTIEEFAALENTINNYNYLVQNGFYSGTYQNYVAEKYAQIYRT